MNISDTKSASRPLAKEEMVDRQWILYSLFPLGALPLRITCFYLFCCLRRHLGEFHLLSAALCHIFGVHLQWLIDFYLVSGVFFPHHILV